MPERLTFPRCDPARAALTNAWIANGCHRLRWRQDDGVGSALMLPDAGDYQGCASAVFELGGVEVRVGLDAHALEQLVQPLLSASEFLDLPEDLQLAVLNHAGGGFAGAFGFEAVCRRCAPYDSDSGGGDGAPGLAFAVEPAAGEPWTLLLHQPRELPESAWRVLRRFGDRSGNGLRSQVRVRADAQAGHTEIPMAALRALEPGDIVIADVCHLDGGLLQLVMPETKMAAMVSLGEGRPARLETALRIDGSLAADDSSTPSNQAPGGQEALAALDDLPVRLEFIAGRVQVPLAELEQMQTGYLVDLQSAADGAVEIQANGRLVGRGELVDLEGRTGVRLLELFKAGT